MVFLHFSSFSGALRKLLPIIALTTIGAPLHAAPQATSTSSPQTEFFYKTGFYLGALAGYSFMDTRINSDVYFDQAVFVVPNDFFRSSRKSGSFVGEVLIGGRYFFRNGFIGGMEGSLTIDNHQQTVAFNDENVFLRQNQIQVQLSRNVAITPSIILGGLISKNLLLFSKLGLSVSYFKLKVANTTPGEGNFTKNQLDLGIVPAVGLEYAMSSRISAVATSSYELYKGAEFTVPTIIKGTLTPSITKIKPRVLTFKIGFIYKI